MVIDSFSAEVDAGYEYSDFNITELSFEDNIQNYYTSLLLSYSLFNGVFEPSIFSKYTNYNNQSAFGYGLDAIIQPFESIKFFLGYSQFEKPYSIVETLDIDSDRNQTFMTFQGGVEYIDRYISSSISFFQVDMKNRLIPYLQSNDPSTTINTISYLSSQENKHMGINLNTTVNFWVLLLSGNLTYIIEDEDQLSKYDETLNINAGIYYVDTLFNSNLNLKTGFTFNYHNNPNFLVYDFLRMRSASFILINNNPLKLSYIADVNDKYRVDFYLAGRIQDAATFYFIYENILGNSYYIVPYYPMPDGGIRIGISWDFLD